MYNEKNRYAKRHSHSPILEPRLVPLFGNGNSGTTSNPPSSSTPSSTGGNTGKITQGSTGTGTGTKGTTPSNTGGDGTGSVQGEGTTPTNGDTHSSSGNSGTSSPTQPDVPPADHTTSSTYPLPTSTSSAPTNTMTSTSTSMPSSTSTVAPTSTSTGLPTSTAAPTSMTTSGGQVVYVTSTLPPAISPTQPATGSQPGQQSQGSEPNVGAIIGGLAGGLVALILIVWLILLPVRSRAKRKQEVDWLSFKPENHEANDDNTNASIFRTPRAGVGEDEDEMALKRANSGAGMLSIGESFQMQDVNHGGMGTMYGHLDGNPHQQWQTGQASDQHHQMGNSGYTVGEIGYDPNYQGYYTSPYVPNTPSDFPLYSPHTSPEMAPTVHRGKPQIGNVHNNFGVPPPDYPYANYGHQYMTPASPAVALQAPVAIAPGQIPLQHSGSISSMRSAPPIDTKGQIVYGEALSQPTTLTRNASANAAYGNISGGGGGGGGGGYISDGGGAGHSLSKSQSSNNMLASGQRQYDQSSTLQRRDSNKMMKDDKSDDLCLPYDRESPSPSPSLKQRNPSNLHLVNPDD